MKNNQLTKSLEPILTEVEKFRKKQLRLKQLEYGFYGVGTILLFLLLLSLGAYGFWLTGIAIILFGVLLAIRRSVVGLPTKNYQEKYRNQVLKGLVEVLNPNIKFVSNNYKYQTKIQNSGLLGTSSFSEDRGILLNGKTKNGYPFQLMEASLIGQEMVAGNRSLATYKGMVFVIEGGHYLGEHTIIQPKKGWVESSMSIYTKTGEEEQFILFSTKNKLASFNDKYVVYTKRRSEADALLSKEVLQKLDALIQAEKAPVHIVLQGKKLFLLLSGVNYFEANIEQSLLGTNAIEKSSEKIKSCLDLVEELSALIGGEKMEIIIKEEIKPLDNARDSAYDHFIEDEL